jgi:hypothetical protein
MKRLLSLAFGLAAIFTAGSLLAHHSFASLFSGEKMVRVKGVIKKFEWINPHSFIIVDVAGSDGKTEQWALEGPAINLLSRQGYSPASLKPGETIQACGYGTREGIGPRVDPASGASSQIMLVELLTLPEGGLPRLWQDYGQHKCRDAQGPGGFRERESAPRTP